MAEGKKESRRVKVCNRCMIGGDNIEFNWLEKIGCFNCGEPIEREVDYEWAKSKGYTIYEQPQIEDVEKTYP